MGVKRDDKGRFVKGSESIGGRPKNSTAKHTLMKQFIETEITRQLTELGVIHA